MIDKTMFKWGLAVTLFATFVLGVCVSHFCMQHKLAALKGENMSRVGIIAFGPHEDKDDVAKEMNSFLDKPDIKYVNHTFSPVHNQESVKSTDEQLFVGSVAYFIKEGESEKKKN